MKKIIQILIFVALPSFYCVAQDMHFSQFYEKPILRNPALAGVFEGDVRVTGIYRNQWQSVTVPFQTGGLSGEIKLPVGKGYDWVTLGTEISYDQAGDLKLKRTQVLPVVCYHKSLSAVHDNYLSVAFMGGYVNSQFDPYSAKWDDQFVNGHYDPSNPTSQVFSNTSYGYWDASTGISYSGEMGEQDHFYLGIGLFHFNNPKTNFYTSNTATTVPQKLTLNSGFKFQTSDIDNVHVYADYLQQGGAEVFIGGVMYTRELQKRYDDKKTYNIGVGAFYRWNDAVIPTVKLDIYDLSIGVSYDVNVSRLTQASQSMGGFEISATWRGKLNRTVEAAARVRCPGIGF